MRRLALSRPKTASALNAIKSSRSVHNTKPLSSLTGGVFKPFLTPRSSTPTDWKISPTLPTETLFEEEKLQAEDEPDFLSVDPGNVLNDRYEVIAKLGYGNEATIWLARDLQQWKWENERHVTLKICRAGSANEIKFTGIMEAGDQSHKASQLPRYVKDHFGIDGPDGHEHVCLVHDLARNSLRDVQRRFEKQRIPLPALKTFTVALLDQLDYLHSQCKIIHTDLRSDNIFLGFSDRDEKDGFVRLALEHDKTCKEVGDHRIYRSLKSVGDLREPYPLPSIGDFGKARRDYFGQPQILPIQTRWYTSPEVMLGTGWNTKADVWNFAVMLCDLVEGKPLFIGSEKGKRHNAQEHIAEMISLFGAPSEELIKQYERSKDRRWTPQVLNRDGNPCDNAADYWGGPFFDSNGDFVKKDIIPGRGDISNSISAVQGTDKEEFLDFLRQMFCWLPEERQTAKELLTHPFVSDVSVDYEKD